MRTLGVDLGNSKVKFVSLKHQAGKLEACWGSYPLPFTADRRSDFEAGLLATASTFAAEHGLERLPDQVVVSTSHFYSYPSFREALHHTADLVAALWEESALLIAADGKLWSPKDAMGLDGRQVLRFAATKFWGSAYLASKLIRHGLSVDVGTTSTDAIAIHDGQIEPTAAEDPDGFNLARLETQRLMWYGMTATPLDYAARQATVGDHTYFLYPRQASTECLTRILDLVSPELAKQHAYFGRYPSRDEALTDLAQAFGLDRELLSETELLNLAANLHRQLIARVAEGLERVIAHARLGEPRAIEAVVMGLGKEALAIPALLACGIPRSKIHDVETCLGSELSAVSTAYGVALKGLEDLLGRSLDICQLDALSR